MAGLIILLLLIMMLIGIPVAFAMGLSAVVYMVVTDTHLYTIPQRIVAQVNRVPLVAVPFFIMAGSLMNRAGITNRIFRFAINLVGWIPGGLGHANVLASMIFAGMSGSAVGDVMGLGLIEMKAMRDAGYDDDFAVGITISSATLGPIIPPSINLIIYGSIVGVSVGSLFLGGILPGTLSGLCMMFWLTSVFKRRKYSLKARPTFGELVISFKGAVPPLLLPLIIFAGIGFGIVTATEAALIAVVYGLFLGIFVYRQIALKDIWNILMDTVVFTGSTLIIVGMSGALGFILTRERVPQGLAEGLLSVSSNIYVLMVLVIIMVLFTGTFIDVPAGIILLAPIFTPAMVSLGVDPVHFGLVLVFGLGIGLITPPVGMCLYAGSIMAGLPLEYVIKASFPYVIPMMVVLFLTACFPEIVLFIPRLLLGE